VAIEREVYERPSALGFVTYCQTHLPYALDDARAERDEVVVMKAVFLPGDGAFIRYIDVPGADPPLLWVHGWQCSSTGELLPAAVQEPLRGRRSLLIDLLGHGYSDKPSGFAYSIEEHARTIVAVIDAEGIESCGLVGHSMGGGVAVHVAAARPGVVSLVVMAEGAIDAGGDRSFAGQTEAEFVDRGFSDLISRQTNEALAAPSGIRAAHLEMTRLIEPRALYREDVSMAEETKPSIRSLLAGLDVPRWYLIGEMSDPEDLERDVATLGVRWKVVPATGHPMGLQNPEGFARSIAEVATASWGS
jgi:pimeloyl-ACP methyl ester carboxylesterase